MFSNWAYILVGDNNTGKTSFQRYVVEALCDQHYSRLPRNVVKPITHPRAPKKLEEIFTANRSYQEKIDEYRTVDNYLDKFFRDADICLLSSHANGDSLTDIRAMFSGLTQRGYNVGAVFWSNAFDSAAEIISREIPWQERFWIENPVQKSHDKAQAQIRSQAFEFSEILIARAYVR